MYTMQDLDMKNFILNGFVRRVVNAKTAYSCKKYF